MEFDGLLFVFIWNRYDMRVYYRVLDRSHGNDDWLPVDDWMPLHDEAIYTPPAACIFEDELKLFYVTSGQSGRFSFHGSLTLQLVSGAWSDVPIVVLQGADDMKYDPGIGNYCPNPADLTKVDRLVDFANSVYAPGLIRFTWIDTHQACKTAINVDDFDWVVVGQEAAPYNPGNLVVVVRRTSGGGSESGAMSSAVVMAEYADTNYYNSHLGFNNNT